MDVLCKLLTATFLLAVFSVPTVVNAELLGRLPVTYCGTDYQAYYDDEADLTWLADANYAQTSGYDYDGLMDWERSTSWVAGLNISGVTGWRLPHTVDVGNDGATDVGYQGVDAGYNITAHSELSNMFYNVLGNTAKYDIYGDLTGCSTTSPLCLTRTGPFLNVQPYVYWSATEYAPDTDLVWDFLMGIGLQRGGAHKSPNNYAWAVRDGDVGAIDTDGDGIENRVDEDDDNDGFLDCDDISPRDPNVPVNISNNEPLAIGLEPYTASTDTDGDGILDINEIGDPFNPADTDFDGVMDALEPGASSTDDRILGFIISENNATLLGVPQLSGSLIQITGDAELGGLINADTSIPMFIEDDLVTSDLEYDFPLGIFFFGAIVGSDTLNVTLQLPVGVNIPNDALLRKLNSSLEWQTVESAIFDRNLNRVSFTILDNGPLDHHPDIGIIIDPFGIGVPQSSASNGSAGESGGGGGGGCSLSRGKTGIDPTLFLICIIFALLHNARKRKLP